VAKLLHSYNSPIPREATINSWTWTFGGGGPSTEQNPRYTYTRPGTYTVSLTVTGPVGSDTKTVTDYILVTGKKA